MVPSISPRLGPFASLEMDEEFLNSAPQPPKGKQSRRRGRAASKPAGSTAPQPQTPAAGTDSPAEPPAAAATAAAAAESADAGAPAGTDAAAAADADEPAAASSHETNQTPPRTAFRDDDDDDEEEEGEDNVTMAAAGRKRGTQRTRAIDAKRRKDGQGQAAGAPEAGEDVAAAQSLASLSTVP